MNALVIGANSEAIFSIQLAHLHGLRVYALDGNPRACGMTKADEAFPVDINDLEKVFAIADPLKPAVVVPAPIGHCLTTIGAVNDRYCLAGVSEQAARTCTDKYQFHTVLSEAGLRDAEAHLIGKGTVVAQKEADRIFMAVSRNHPASLILKPRDGSGSRGVVTCPDPEAFREAIRFLNYGGPAELCSESGQMLQTDPSCVSECGFPEDYIAETCIPGDEYGIDGGYVGGEFHMTLLRHKRNTPLPYRQCVGYASVLPEEAPGFYHNCERMMQKAGEAIGLMNCVVHADVIRRTREVHPDDLSVKTGLTDEPFIIEMSARPSGHNLSNLFTPLATGTTIVDDFLNLALSRGAGMDPASLSRYSRAAGLSGDDYREFCRHLFRPKYTKKLLIRYFDLKPGTVAGLPDPSLLREMMQEKVLAQYHCTLRNGDVLEPVTDGASVMGRGYFILQGRTEEELEESAQKVLGMFEIDGNAGQ